MRRFVIAIILFTVIPAVLSRAATKDRPNSTGPGAVVEALYQDFGWELSDRVDDKRPILIDQSQSVLSKYFAPDLSARIIENRQYEVRTGYICPPGFEPLCGSQDPGGIGNIRISKDPLSDDVILVYDQSGEKDVMTITFKMGKVHGAWKIQDAIYKTRTCKGFPGPPRAVSLRKQAFQKC